MSKKLLWGFVFMLAFVCNAIAQDKPITGKVTSSEDGSPLPGVNVIVKGSNRGTTTKNDGTYSISAPSSATLVYTFVGYQKAEVRVAGRTAINVVLENNSVVVIFN